MKPTFPFLILLTALASASFTQASGDDKPKTPLAQQMSGMAKDVRALHKVVNDPAQKDAALQLIHDMETRATKARGFEPIKTKDIPPVDHGQFIADYQKQIDGLIADFHTLEGDVEAGKTADASAMLDKIQTDKRAGHKKFNAEKD